MNLAAALASNHVHSIQRIKGGGTPMEQTQDEDGGGIPGFSDGTSFIATLDGDFSIPAANRSEQIPSRFGGGLMATVSLEWGTMTSSFPPTTETARRD